MQQDAVDIAVPQVTDKRKQNAELQQEHAYLQTHIASLHWHSVTASVQSSPSTPK